MSASLSPKKEVTLNKDDESQTKKAKSLVWDCDSTLYDSYELRSFKRQLDSAIDSRRTLSMPHLTDHRNHPPQPKPQPPPPLPPIRPVAKKPSRLSRSFQRLLGIIFRSKQDKSQDKYYFVYDTSSALTTIPEAPESGGDHSGVSPDVKSLVRKTASDRFTAAASIGISCA